jgi:hypothetical protein
MRSTLPIALLTAVFLSCTAHVASRRYIGVLPETPVPPASVQILEHAPSAPYRQLGEIRVEWPGIRTVADVLHDGAIRDALREAGGRLGADCVVVLHFLHRPGYGRLLDDAPPAVLVAMAISTKPPADRRKGLQMTSAALPR